MEELVFVQAKVAGSDYEKNSLLGLNLVAYKKGEFVDKTSILFKRKNYTVDARVMQLSNLKLIDCHFDGVAEEEGLEKIEKFISKNFNKKVMLAGFNVDKPKQAIKNLFRKYKKDYSKLLYHKSLDLTTLIWLLNNKGILQGVNSYTSAIKYYEINNEHESFKEEIYTTISLFESLMDSVDIL